jgi:hypothetical protein
MSLSNDDIKQLISILQKGLSNEDDTDVSIDSPKTKKTRVASQPKNKKPKRVNKFEKMAEFSMCKEDLEFDRKVKKPPPSERSREFKYINMNCVVCGKKEKVPSTLLNGIERYKCNKCSTGAG